MEMLEVNITEESSDIEMKPNIKGSKRKTKMKMRSKDNKITISNKWEEDQQFNEDLSDEQSVTNSNQEELCAMCTTLLPKVTTANLQFMKDVINQLQIMHERRLRRESQQGEYVQSNLRARSQTDSTDKIELMARSGVFVNRQFLSNLLRDYRQKPKEMVRRLLKLLVGKNKLVCMSAMGEGMRFQAVPPGIKLAVQEWVQRKSKKELSLTDYNRTINLMCGNLRRKEKSDKKRELPSSFPLDP